MSAAPTERARRRALLLPEREDDAVEQIWYCRSVPYYEYRQTRWWKWRRQAFLRRHRSCDCCGAVQDKTYEPWVPRFHVHHLTYDSLGEEPDSDLSCVCSLCHNLIHRPDSHAARHWVDFFKTAKGIDLDVKAETMRPVSE